MSGTNNEAYSLMVVSAGISGRNTLVLELATPDGTALPTWAPGAHIDIETRDDTGRVVMRQYSLCGDPLASTWRVGILMDENGRGGSRWLHQSAKPGVQLSVRGPRNHFRLVDDQRPVVLVAGGIGITPLMAMAQAMSRARRPFRLSYHVRSRAAAAFIDELSAVSYASSVAVYVDDEGAKPLDQLFTEKDGDAWVYTCGPSGFMHAVAAAATARGVPSERIRRELFGADETVEKEASAAKTDGAFIVKLQSSGQAIEVAADETVVHALARAGVNVVVSCEQGHCGSCLTRVLEGMPDHRDQFMLPEEHERNDAFTPCCSRSLSPCLVLDL